MAVLAAEEFGAGEGGDAAVPLLVAHGLFGSARNWRGLARALARGRRVIAVDMRNHGASPRMPTQSYADMAGDLAETILARAGGRADVLGHSMGGKAAMVLALSEPARVDRLVVADIAPVAYSRSHAGLVAALQGLDLARIATRAEADAALAARVPDPALRAFLLQSLVLGEAGGPRWTLNLPVLAAAMPELTGFPDLDGAFPGEALFLRGDLSDYVQPAHVPRIRALFPRARIEAVAGAGHWLHAERPREVLAAAAAFLSR